MKTPIVISTLEEDFKKIGLIKANLVESVQAEQAEDAGDDSEELSERRNRTRVQKKGSRYVKVKTHKTDSTKKRMDKQYYRSHKNIIARKLRKKKATAAGRRAMVKADAAAKKFGTHKNEDVDFAELMKSFANAAIIAENLQTIFTEWYEADLFDAEADEVLVDFVEQLEAIAEDFADAATALHESADGEEIDGDLVEMFKEGLDVVLDAVDLYEGTKEEATDDEGMCEECDDEECEGCEGND